VPIGAFIFGGRRETTVPLVCRAFTWNHGVYIGATVGSKRTGARARETAIGWVPCYDDIAWAGLGFPREKWDRLTAIDRDTWEQQTFGHEDLFLKLSDHLPKELIFERELPVLARRA
jgi:GTP-dependent phosphoenolpyruvate carboxykinase